MKREWPHLHCPSQLPALNPWERKGFHINKCFKSHFNKYSRMKMNKLLIWPRLYHTLEQAWHVWTVAPAPGSAWTLAALAKSIPSSSDELEGPARHCSDPPEGSTTPWTRLSAGQAVPIRSETHLPQNQGPALPQHIERMVFNAQWIHIRNVH